MKKLPGNDAAVKMTGEVGDFAQTVAPNADECGVHKSTYKYQIDISVDSQLFDPKQNTNNLTFYFGGSRRRTSNR
jgi:hypothetical protein